MNYINLGIQIFHALITIICVLFPHFFPQFDLYYLIYIFLIALQWNLLKGECFISYLEKITLNKSYKLGDDPKLNPFYDMIGQSTMNLLNSIHTINFILILYRNYYSSNFIILLTLIILIIILQIIIDYKYPKKKL